MKARTQDRQQGKQKLSRIFSTFDKSGAMARKPFGFCTLANRWKKCENLGKTKQWCGDKKRLCIDGGFPAIRTSALYRSGWSGESVRGGETISLTAVSRLKAKTRLRLLWFLSVDLDTGVSCCPAVQDCLTGLNARAARGQGVKFLIIFVVWKCILPSCGRLSRQRTLGRIREPTANTPTFISALPLSCVTHVELTAFI